MVPKSFSFAQIIYPSEARNQVAFSCGRRGTTVVVDEELDCVKDTSSVIVFDDFATSSPTGEGILKVIATSVAVGQLPQVADFSTSEPIGSACGMPQGGYRKPPARLVVMTISPRPSGEVSAKQTERENRILVLLISSGFHPKPHQENFLKKVFLELSKTFLK